MFNFYTIKCLTVPSEFWYTLWPLPQAQCIRLLRKLCRRWPLNLDFWTSLVIAPNVLCSRRALNPGETETARPPTHVPCPYFDMNNLGHRRLRLQCAACWTAWGPGELGSNQHWILLCWAVWQGRLSYSLKIAFILFWFFPQGLTTGCHLSLWPFCCHPWTDPITSTLLWARRLDYPVVASVE
jgi:hypothetical protein